MNVICKFSIVVYWNDEGRLEDRWLSILCDPLDETENSVPMAFVDLKKGDKGLAVTTVDAWQRQLKAAFPDASVTVTWENN